MTFLVAGPPASVCCSFFSLWCAVTPPSPNFRLISFYPGSAHPPNRHTPLAPD